MARRVKDQPFTGQEQIREQGLTDTPIKIPQYILKIYSQVNCQFSKKAFSLKAKQDPRVDAWFKKISDKYGFQISPHYVYLAAVKYGLTLFMPKRCLYCGKLLGLDKVIRQFCSKECRFKSDIPKKKLVSTLLKRYGVTSPAKSKAVQDKMKATCLARYGVENVYQAEQFKEKIRNTNLVRRGVDYPMQSVEVRDKSKQTCLQKYGTDSFSKTNEFKEKNKRTMLERYGVDNTLKSKSLRNKFTNTMISRYGVPYTAQSEDLKKKFIKSKRNNHFEVYKSILGLKNIDCLSSKENYISYKPMRLQCRSCGYTWLEEPTSITTCIICKECKAKNLACSSLEEKDLLSYISSLYSGKIVSNTRAVITPYELDIYLPEKKLAFEFNGTYWHSENLGLDPNYHFHKTKLCNQLGIRLIHIFEYEWMYNQNKIKNLIKSALGIFEHKLYARNCKIKDISSKDYEIFLIENHLQGSVKSSIRYGLFYNNELVSVIGFGKSRYKKDELELHRYCVKAGYQIIGGFSKLIKDVCKLENIKKFISYIDLAHFSGKGYKKVGFTKVSISKPSYVYIKEEQILSRYQCQKHKLKSLLGDSFDPKLSESDNMMLANYKKIYDSGSLKVALELDA